MTEDHKLRCGCVEGVRIVIVEHCGGHGIPPKRRIEDANAVEALVTRVTKLENRLKEFEAAAPQKRPYCRLHGSGGHQSTWCSSCIDIKQWIKNGRY